MTNWRRSLGNVPLTIIFMFTLVITDSNGEEKPIFLARMDREFSTSPDLILNGSTVQLKCIYENVTDYIRNDSRIIFKKIGHNGMFPTEFYHYRLQGDRLNGSVGGSSIQPLEGAVILTIQVFTLEHFQYFPSFQCGIQRGGSGPKVFSNEVLLDIKVKPYIKTLTLDTCRSSCQAGSRIKAVCHLDLGRPMGQIIWTKKRPQDPEFTDVSYYARRLYRSKHPSGTWGAKSVYRHTVTLEDHGMILRCSCKNDALRSGEPLPYKQIVINVLFAPQELQIIPPNLPYHPGQRIQCHAKAFPPPDYEWTKVSGRQDLDTDGEWLTVPMDTMEENLEYRCRVNNTYGEITKEFNIYVTRGQITTEISLDNTNPLPDTNVTFKCSTPTGYPTVIALRRLSDNTIPVISYKGLAQLQDGVSDRVRVVSSDWTEVVLSLRVILEEDAGGWVCEADGVVSETVYITFED